MKKYITALSLLTLVLMLSFGLNGFTQAESPVKWAFSCKKIGAGSYEMHLTATIDEGWHTYSQTTPEGGPRPTAIHFTSSPLLTIDGKPKEVGKMEQHAEPLFGVDVKQFSDKVDFVQTVKVKGSAKTTVTGTINFMVCNDHECLPPATQTFSIALK
jgi:DsbC/DsbD-like thiol-disulfide interchange protein